MQVLEAMTTDVGQPLANVAADSQLPVPSSLSPVTQDTPVVPPGPTLGLDSQPLDLSTTHQATGDGTVVSSGHTDSTCDEGSTVTLSTTTAIGEHPNDNPCLMLVLAQVHESEPVASHLIPVTLPVQLAQDEGLTVMAVTPNVNPCPRPHPIIKRTHM